MTVEQQQDALKEFTEISKDVKVCFSALALSIYTDAFEEEGYDDVAELMRMAPDERNRIGLDLGMSYEDAGRFAKCLNWAWLLWTSRNYRVHHDLHLPS